MTKLSTESYKGAKDWYPEELLLRDYIFNTWRNVVESFGYQGYDAPIIEPIEVYEAKSGQELVSEQTYQFTDRGSRRVAIRPEMTPSVSRMIAARRQETPLPARWYSIAQFMRYERPQRGRDREFWQLNCDIFGSDDILAEAEIIKLASELLKSLGASDQMFSIRINNRNIINFMMAQYLELEPSQAQSMVRLFDRKNKISNQAFREQASDIFGKDRAESGLRKLAQINAARSMVELPEEIRDTSGVREIQELFTELDRMGVKNAVFDISLMRGLDYYTGTVFEVFDTHPENSRSLFGGGRYDGLIGLFGVQDVSAVGFAPGLSMVQLFLEVHGLLPELTSRTDLYLSSIDEASRGEASKIADDLRKSGINVEFDWTDRKMDKKIKTASKKSIRYSAFIGENEITTRVVQVKNLATGDSIELPVADISDYIKSNLIDQR